MIPYEDKKWEEICGFPRVSGGDPFFESMRGPGKTFSPRERG